MTTRDRRDQEAEAHTDALLESLFKDAPPRRDPPPEQERYVRERFEAEWRRVVARRRRKRVGIAFAAAASLALVAIGVPRLMNLETVSAPPPVAVVERAEASPSLVTDAGTTALVAGDVLMAGGSVATGNGRLALRLGERLSLRLDRRTRVTFASPERLKISAGRVYVDTGVDGASSDRLVLETPFGEVTHVGTQYLVALDPVALTAQVRSGRVTVRVDDSNLSADPGEGLRVDATGRSKRSEVPIHGEAWDWTRLVAPGFDAEGRSLADFLAWVERETGFAVAYESAEARRIATASVLHGRIDLEPLRALDVILQTSDLRARVEDEAIIVDLFSR